MGLNPKLPFAACGARDNSAISYFNNNNKEI